MSNYTQIYYQIVFSTKHRNPTIDVKYDRELYKYIYGIVKQKKCKLYRINGVEDHIHLFTSLHPTLALCNFIKDIKVASSLWMKESGLFPLFNGWQLGYGAFTYCLRERDKIINYVKNQKTHHSKETYYDEFKRLLAEHGVEFDVRFLL